MRKLKLTFFFVTDMTITDTDKDVIDTDTVTDITDTDKIGNLLQLPASLANYQTAC